MVHPLEVKLDAIALCKQGKAISHVAKELGCSKNVVTMWLEQYRRAGLDGLDKKPYNCRYNFTEKCKIICEIEENDIPLHIVCAKYRIARSTISRWLFMVRKEGYEALRNVNSGRKQIDMGRPKKQAPQTDLEKLQRENELLRTENAYLKKLRALMIEKTSFASRTKH